MPSGTAVLCHGELNRLMEAGATGIDTWIRDEEIRDAAGIRPGPQIPIEPRGVGLFTFWVRNDGKPRNSGSYDDESETLVLNINEPSGHWETINIGGPQNSSRTKQTNPVCWTVTKLLRRPDVLRAFRVTWTNTERSAEKKWERKEHGGWIFADQQTGDLFIHLGAVGTNRRFDPDNKQLNLLLDMYENASHPVKLILQFHSHWNDQPLASDGDVEYLDRPGWSAKGVIITGLERYSVFDKSTQQYQWSDPRLDDCL